MPTEIIVMASLALTLLLVAGVWSVAVPKCDPSGALKADQTSGELTIPDPVSRRPLLLPLPQGFCLPAFGTVKHQQFGESPQMGDGPDKFHGLPAAGAQRDCKFVLHLVRVTYLPNASLIWLNAEIGRY